MSINPIKITGASPIIINQKSPWGVQSTGNNDDGAIYQFNQGTPDTFSYGASNVSKNVIFCGDSSDTLNLTGGWTDAGLAQDTGSKIGGRLFKDSKGDQLLVSGNVHLTGDITGTSDTLQPSSIPGSSGQLPDPKTAAYRLSHDGQWEFITGGDKTATLTLAQANAALNKPGLSADTKAALQQVINSWSTMGFQPDQKVTLQQMQDYGDGKPASGSGSAVVNGKVNFNGKHDASFGADDKALKDRVNWAVRYAGGGDNDVIDTDGNMSAADVQLAINGIHKAEKAPELDANKPDAIANDEKQIKYLQGLIGSTDNGSNPGDPIKDQLNQIENDKTNLAAGGNPDDFVTGQEIQNALNDQIFKNPDDAKYWQGVLTSLQNDQKTGKNDTNSETKNGQTGVTAEDLIRDQNLGIDFKNIKPYTPPAPDRRAEVKLFADNKWILGWAVSQNQEWGSLNLNDALTKLAASKPGDSFWSRTDHLKQDNNGHFDSSSPSSVTNPQVYIDAAIDLLKSPALVKLMADQNGNIAPDTLGNYWTNHPTIT